MRWRDFYVKNRKWGSYSTCNENIDGEYNLCTIKAEGSNVT